MSHIPYPAHGDDGDEPSLPGDVAREDAAPAGAAGDGGEDEHFDPAALIKKDPGALAVNMLLICG